MGRIRARVPWGEQVGAVPLLQFENNYLPEMCSGSEVGSYLRLIDFVYREQVGAVPLLQGRPARRVLQRVTYRGTSLIRTDPPLLGPP